MWLSSGSWPGLNDNRDRLCTSFSVNFLLNCVCERWVSVLLRAPTSQSDLRYSLFSFDQIDLTTSTSKLSQISHRSRRTVTSPQNLKWGTQIQMSCFKISSTKLLLLQCSKKLTNPIYDSIFTTFQKYIFNVHQITTLGGNNSIFFWQGHGQNTVHNSPKHTRPRP